MQFNHLIQINDPLNPFADVMTREQLWRGLVMRAEQPMLFVDHLDKCYLSNQSNQSVTRELHYGKVVIRDFITYLPQLQVRYTVPPQQDINGSSLTMTIEEPELTLLFVRFEYVDQTNHAQNSDEEEFYGQFRRSAYEQADIDTIQTIRELVKYGKL